MASRRIHTRFFLPGLTNCVRGFLPQHTFCGSSIVLEFHEALSIGQIVFYVAALFRVVAVFERLLEIVYCLAKVSLACIGLSTSMIGWPKLPCPALT
jgi:hypothetical protein